MKVCYILFGFSRAFHNSDVLRNYFREQFPHASQIDIYWYCPTTFDSESDVVVDKDDLYNELLNANLGKVHIEWFEYNPIQFYRKSMELGFTHDDVAITRHPPARKLSLIYNMSKSVELAYTISAREGIDYQLAVVSRFDLIPNVMYNIQNDINNGVYLYRTYMHEGSLVVEDRAFYGNPEYIFKVREFYNLVHTVFNKSTLESEILLAKLFANTMDNTKLYVNSTIRMPLLITSDDRLRMACDAETAYILRESRTHLYTSSFF